MTGELFQTRAYHHFQNLSLILTSNMQYDIYKQLFRQSKATRGTLYCYTSALCEDSIRDHHVNEINFMRNQNEKVGFIGSRLVAGVFCK